VGIHGDKKMKIVTTVLIATFAASAWAQTYVKPHVRKDGTYVEGHVRSAPNKTDADNYGTKGNTNPYTGQAGTNEPTYGQPAPRYQAPSYGQQCGYTQAGNYVCR
jgi:hypothetical protein